MMMEWRGKLFAFAAVVLSLGRACAAGPVDAASFAPSDVDLFISVDDASGWRRGAGGAMLTGFMGSFAERGEMSAAWKELSVILGMDESRAFDALLGWRVVFVRRTLPDASSEWALVSVVRPEVEKQVRAKLRPAPRRVNQGVPVLSLEDGRLLLATASRAEHAVLMLGPAAASGLFERMLPTLGGTLKQNLAESKVGGDLRSVLEGSGALMLLRRRDSEGRLQVTTLGARSDAESIALGAIVRSERVAESMAGTPTISRRTIVPLVDAERALLWSYEDGGSALIRALDLDLLGDVYPRWLASFDGASLLGSRKMFAVAPADAGGVHASMAIETADRTALAPKGDRYLAGLLRGLSGNLDATAARGLDFEGLFPSAVREVDLESTGIREIVQGESLALVWVYAGEDGALPGWWVIGNSVDIAERMARSASGVRPVAGAAAAEDPDTTRAWVWFGSMRPRALVSSLLEGLKSPPSAFVPAIESLSGFESIEWGFHVGDGGSLRGSARVQMVGGADAGEDR